MATKTAILAVRIVSDATQAQQGFQQTASAADRLGSSLDALTPIAAATVGALALIGAKAVSAASDLQQATGAVEAVFGEYADQVKGFADDAARNVGLAESQYSQLASVLGAQLKNMQVPMEDVAGQTNELITLGADLAATFGGTTADAVAALSSLLRGERDPIERYGVSIKQADINAQKAAMGLQGLTGEAAKQADAQATLALLYQQTGSSAGQFTRELDTLAGQQQVANATWEDASAALGESLLPIMTEFAGIAIQLAEFIKENSTAVTIFIAVVGSLAAAILLANAAIKAYEIITTVATAAQWLWNVAMSANPIGLIIIAIAALIAIIVLLVQHWDEVAAVAADVWGAVIGWIQEVGYWFEDVFASIKQWWEDLIASFEHGFDQLFGWVNDAIGWLGNLGNQKSALGPLQAIAPRAAAPAVAGLVGAEPYFNQIVPVRSTTSGSVAGRPINITVNGALDSEAVGRQIHAILKGYDARVGLRVAAGRR